MTVLMPNTSATVLRRQEAGFDEHGERVRNGFVAAGAMHPARVRQRGDGGWAIGVDTALWPVRQGDLILDEQGYTYLVETSDLITNNVRSDVDWVRVAALVRSAGSTTPGDAWSVGRYGTPPAAP